MKPFQIILTVAPWLNNKQRESEQFCPRFSNSWFKEKPSVMKKKKQLSSQMKNFLVLSLLTVNRF